MYSWFGGSTARILGLGGLTQVNSYMFGQGKVASLATPSIYISAREKTMSLVMYRKEEETENLIVLKLQEDRQAGKWIIIPHSL